MKRVTFNKKTRESILRKYDGHCAYCGCKLTPKSMRIDHIHPVWNKGTNDLDNLNPACTFCNNYKSGNKLESFRSNLNVLLNKNRRYLFASTGKMKLAENFGVIEYKQWNKLFYYEQIHGYLHQENK